jgi:putative membrane protein insertion efficiency factor
VSVLRAMLRVMDRALAWVLLSGVWAYRVTLSPWMGRQCRYEPTCSAYALGALRGHGGVRGAWLAARRVLRCHPFARGGYDPVPITDAPPRDGRAASRTSAGSTGPAGGGGR